MSDEAYDPETTWPPPDWMNLEGMAGWQRHHIGVLSVIKASNDPENTMQAALTHADLALFVFGAMLVADLFPECREQTSNTLRKLGELTTHQQFLPPS